MAQLHFSCLPVAAPATRPATAPGRCGASPDAPRRPRPATGAAPRPVAGDVSDLPWVEVVVPVPAEPLDTAPGAGGADGAADEAANAPGWFDATWALQQGLDVIEGLPADLALALWREAAAA